MIEKTFEEWLKENPEKEEELKKYQLKNVSKPPKFCWELNSNTTPEEVSKLYKEGKIDIQSPKLEKQITPYGQKKIEEEKKVKEWIKNIQDQILKAKKSND